MESTLLFSTLYLRVLVYNKDCNILYKWVHRLAAGPYGQFDPAHLTCDDGVL